MVVLPLFAVPNTAVSLAPGTLEDSSFPRHPLTLNAPVQVIVVASYPLCRAIQRSFFCRYLK